VCTGCRYSKHANWTIHVTGPGVHKSWVPGHWGNCICMMTFKVCGSSVWNSLNVVNFLCLILGWPVVFFFFNLCYRAQDICQKWKVWKLLLVSLPPPTKKEELFQHIDKCSVVCKAIWPKQGNILLENALFNGPPSKVDYAIYVFRTGMETDSLEYCILVKKLIKLNWTPTITTVTCHCHYISE
jgi:hypothetical protein